MKLLHLFLLFLVFMSCSDAKKYKDDDPRSLIGKWEIAKVHYNEVYVPDGPYTEEEVNGMKNTWISFEDGQKVSVSVWIKEGNHTKTLVSKGIYELDVETGRVRIEIPEYEPNFHAGSFFWKIKKDQLYLNSTNRKGDYKVYNRSE